MARKDLLFLLALSSVTIVDLVAGLCEKKEEESNYEVVSVYSCSDITQPAALKLEGDET